MHFSSPRVRWPFNPAIFFLALLYGCGSVDDPTPQKLPSTQSTTCKGNQDGLYCLTNPALNVDLDDELYETDLIRCKNSQVVEVLSCMSGCLVKAPGINDVCANDVLTTCKGNKDGWYCSGNPELNIDPKDELYESDLVHCVSSKSIEVMSCTYGCTVKPSGMNDVCTPPEAINTCKGNKDGWYCAQNPELVRGPNDELFDTDLIHCQSSKSIEVKSCINGCMVKPSGVDDVCAGAVCGNNVVEDAEKCDGGNMAGHNCATEGYNAGSISCTNSCTLNISNCCKHQCTGTTQCVGNIQQTCKDNNSDGCNEWVNTGNCATCGDGNVNNGEQCDGFNLNGHTCLSEGFNGGQISCINCAVNTSGCCKHQCTGTTQCVGTQQQTCKDGNNDGCNEWVNTGSCAPTCSTAIASNSCFNWTYAAGGSYEIFQVCAESLGGDQLRVRMRKALGGTFGSRPYGLRVFGANDGECSHDTTYYQVVNPVSVSGIGTEQLTMEFNVTWAVGQTSKRYCGFASTIYGDPGYDANNQQQKLWWYSQSLLINRICN